MTAATAPRLRRAPFARDGLLEAAWLSRGIVLGYVSLIVLLPLAAVAWRAAGGGWETFWRAVTAPDAIAALELTVGASALVSVVNAVMGTVIAWVLVRDRFVGHALVESVIDLPFALPTIVAGLTLLALYGPRSPVGLNLAYSRAGVVVALLFVTLPFVVRSVQPVLAEVEREAEEAAACLGAYGPTIVRRIILPNLLPSILSGAALGFARALGEFGSVVLISGNMPMQTEVMAVHIYGQIQSDDAGSAAALSIELLAVSLLVLLVIQLGTRRLGAMRG